MSSDAVTEEIGYLQAIFDALSDVIVLFRYDEQVGDSVTVWCNRAALMASGAALFERDGHAAVA